MKLKIQNKKKFVKEFLDPISALDESVGLVLKDRKITGVLTSADGTVIFKAVYKVDYSFEEEITLAIPRVHDLKSAILLIPDEEIELEINTNNLSYNNNGFKFTYHLLDKGFLEPTALNFKKVKELSYDTVFNVTSDAVSTFLKGSSFTKDAGRVYFYTENGKVMAEHNNKNKHNINSFASVISQEFQGEEMEPCPVEFDTFSLLCPGITSFDNTTFSYCNEKGIFCIISKNDQVELFYVISNVIN